MDSFFGSHKGRRYKKVGIALIALALVFLVIKPGGGDSSSRSNAATLQYENKVNYSRVYATATASPTPSATPTAGINDEAVITSSVKLLARDFATSWTTYDYQKPPSYESIKGAAKDKMNNGELKKKYVALMNDAKNRKELSTGAVGSVNITGLNYSGDAKSGSGEGTVKVSVTQTISNAEVGTAGSSVIHTYDVKVRKLTGVSSLDNSEWFVYDIVTTS